MPFQKLSPTGRNLDLRIFEQVQIMWLAQDMERVIMGGLLRAGRVLAK